MTRIIAKWLKFTNGDRTGTRRVLVDGLLCQLRRSWLGARGQVCLEVLSLWWSVVAFPLLCSVRVGRAEAGQAEASAALEAIQAIPLSCQRSKRMSRLRA